MLNSKANRYIVKSRPAGETLTLILVMLLAACLTSSSSAQDTWTKKADFGGSERYNAIGFSIGNKGYIGTGYGGGPKKDFWEYDPDADTWTQKADFGGGVRQSAVCFSIGSKGYIGTGFDVLSNTKDFWEYDPDVNVWTKKAYFGGDARSGATGFSIGTKGYIGTGNAGFTYYKDFWEYDPDVNVWTQKADFGGDARVAATGFSIGIKGYIGTGFMHDGAYNYYKDFWEYDPDSNSWLQKADFGGGVRSSAVGFSIDSKGYIGTGYENGIGNTKDFWEYNPDSDTWTQKADCGGDVRSDAVGFSIGSKGYIGTASASATKDFWEYTSAGSPCALPTALSSTDIKATSAKLSWSEVSGAAGYKLTYKIAGASEWAIVQSADDDKTIHELAPGAEYVWRVKSICEVEPINSSAWSEKEFFTTDPLRLEAAGDLMFEVYPNPASQFAAVSFFLKEASSVVIEILDADGRTLRVIAKKDFSDGSHEVTFHRERLIAGIYLLRVKTKEAVMMKKVIVE